MAVVYRKTSKGQSEIATREHHLDLKLRSALIVVDGRRSTDDLQRMIPGNARALLETLRAEGYLEAAPEVAPELRTDVRTEPRPEATARVANEPAAAVIDSPPPTQLRALRQDSVRFINEQLGPHGEYLALKIEKSRDWSELRHLLEMAGSQIADIRGKASAEAFQSRFLR